MATCTARVSWLPRGWASRFAVVLGMTVLGMTALAPVAAAQPSGPASPERPYREGARVPAGYHVEADVDLPLVMGGAAVFAVSYGMGIGLAAYYQFHDHGAWMFAPVVGPFVYMGTRDGCDGGQSETAEALCGVGDAFVEVGAVVGGLTQLTGVTLLIVGLATMEDVLVPDDEPPGAEVAILPVPLRDGGAIGVVGRF